jgi:hypothetical protein
MDRIPGAAALIAHGRPAATLLLCGVLMLALIVRPTLAQTAAPPGSTINGSVPSSEGNVWNGFDHQPTAADAGPSGTAKHQARINHKLSKLDQQLLNDPLPKIPAGAPSVPGN